MPFWLFVLDLAGQHAASSLSFLPCDCVFVYRPSTNGDAGIQAANGDSNDHVGSRPGKEGAQQLEAGSDTLQQQQQQEQTSDKQQQQQQQQQPDQVQAEEQPQQQQQQQQQQQKGAGSSKEGQGLPGDGQTLGSDAEQASAGLAAAGLTVEQAADKTHEHAIAAMMGGPPEWGGRFDNRYMPVYC